jgi:hypothetical protein
MQLPPHSFEPELVALMGSVVDEAWEEAHCRLSFPDAVDLTGLRNLVALRVMAAVANGERDPERLRLMALAALDA